MAGEGLGAGAALSASSRMCTIKQKWKIIRSERGLALSEMWRKVRLNPICQKTEGSGEGGAGGGKLELLLGGGRGAGDPSKTPFRPPPEHRSPVSAPCLLPGTPGHLGWLYCQKKPPKPPSQVWAPALQGPGRQPAVVYGVVGTNQITASLVPWVLRQGCLMLSITRLSPL